MIPLALLIGQATINYTLSMEGGAVGEARLTQTVRPEGGKTVRMVATVRRANTSLEIRSESVFDAKGSPVRKLQSYGPSGRAAEHEVIVSFDASGARAVVRDRGVPKVVAVPIGPKLERANAAETWFFAVKPKVGAVAKAWVFDPNELEWVSTETTYVGPASGGHRLKIVRKDRTGEVIVDERGMPVTLQDGGMRLSRRIP